MSARLALCTCSSRSWTVDVGGQLEGINREAVASVVDAVEIPVIASGGVVSVDDVVALNEAGAGAVVVGTALYEGEFTLEEAMAAVRA